MVKILVDAMGGDNAPAATVQGSVLALEKDKDLYLVLTGRQADIEAELKKYKYDKSRLEIVDCPDVIDMNDIPTEAIKRKQSSLVAGFWKLKKEDDLCALVTAGSTGATIVGGQLILGRIRGIKRPALCPAIPNSRGRVTMLCDCGANAECKPVMLCQFAVLASAYAEVGFGISSPKVGLLSNGTEEHKGDPLHQETYKYLSKMQVRVVGILPDVCGKKILPVYDHERTVPHSGNTDFYPQEQQGNELPRIYEERAGETVQSLSAVLPSKPGIRSLRTKRLSGWQLRRSLQRREFLLRRQFGQ